MTLTEALDAFLEPPLDKVEIDLDIKLPGREEEFVEALRERGLIDRAMISTMEMHTLKRVLELEPKLRRGWTYPKAGRDLSTALGQAGAPGGALACASTPGHRGRESCPSSASSRCGSTTRWSAPNWPGSATSPGSS